MESKSFKSKTYYEILGISREAELKEIKQNYHELARVYHPDSQFYNDIIDEKLSDEQIELFKIITNAYHTLVDPIKRAEYDQSLAPVLGKTSKSWDNNADSFWSQKSKSEPEEPKRRKRSSTFGQTGARPFKSTLHGELKRSSLQELNTRKKPTKILNKPSKKLNPVVMGLSLGVFIVVIISVLLAAGGKSTNNITVTEPATSQPDWRKNLDS